MFRLLLLTLILTPLLALGQFQEDGNLPLGIKEQVSVKVTPEIPKPGEEFDIRIQSYSTDLNKATITWTVNGVNEASGRGFTTFKGVAPQNGGRLNIVVTMNKSNGGTITETINIAPAEVELVYEAQTYTHPFYKGKSLYTNESNVRVVAFPNVFSSNGTRISEDNLVYTWKVDKKVMQSQSGFGRNVLDYKGNLIARPIKVEVTVESLNSDVKAKNSFILDTVNPAVLIYGKDPSLGTLFELNLNGRQFDLTVDEIEVTAKPFFFSTDRSGVGNLKYDWTLNGNTVFNFNSENSILFRKEPNTSGVARINIGVKHMENILQSSSANVVFELPEEELEDFEF